MKFKKPKISKKNIGIASAMICLMASAFSTPTFAETIDNTLEITSEIQYESVINEYLQSNLFNMVQEDRIISTTGIFNENLSNYNCNMSYPITNNYSIDTQIQNFITNLKWSFRLTTYSHNENIINSNYDLVYEDFQIDDKYYTVVFTETKTSTTVVNSTENKKIYIKNYNKETGESVDTNEILNNNLEPEKVAIFKEAVVSYLKNYLYGEINNTNMMDYDLYKSYLTIDNVQNHLVFEDNEIKFYANSNEVLPEDRGIVNLNVNMDTLMDILGEDFFLPEVEEIIEEIEEVENLDPLAGSGIFLVDVDGTMVYKQGNEIDPNKPMVALTYDDGPNPIHTNRILNALEKHNVVATFFDIGRSIDAYPEVVQRQVALGCELGNHTYYHDNYTTLSAAAIRADIQKANNAYMNAVGFIPTLFRPPYGSTNSTVVANVSATEILWSIDTRDWQNRNSSAIMNKIYAESNLDGHVILMHGIYESTADATEIMIPYILEKGYQIVNVSDLLEFKYGVTPTAGKSYGYNFFGK